MRALFLSHTGEISGAEVAMLRLIEGLGSDVDVALACPRGGTLANEAARRDIPTYAIAGADVSLRLGARTGTRALASVARSADALRSALARHRPDIVHANTLRAGLIAALPRAIGRTPLIVQSHEHLPPGLASRLTREVISRTADHVIAVTDWTARVFNEGLARPVAQRVYIGIDHACFASPRRSREEVLAGLGLDADGPVLGQVAQITPWKGQDVSIRALARIRERFPAARLLIVGSPSFRGGRFDTVAYLASLESLARDLGLADAVHFVGQRDDVPELLAALDLHLLPSWDEPFGTVSAEAMAVGTVPFATAVGGMPEYVEDGACGRVLPPHEPAAWADAAIELLEDPERRRRMGARARRAAARFTVDAYARDVRAAWEKAIERAHDEPTWRRVSGQTIAPGRAVPSDQRVA